MLPVKNGQEMALPPGRLKEARLAAGLSQKELARRCNVGEQNIWRYESEGVDPPSEVLGVMARILGVSADFLLGLTDSPNGLPQDGLRADQRYLLSMYESGDVPTLLEFIAERLRKLNAAQSLEDDHVISD